MIRRLNLVAFTASALICLSGCNREEIHSYRIPRERDFEKAALERGLRQAGVPAGEAQVQWVKPETWTELPSSGSVRMATFQSDNGVEIAVTAFPGDVGGLLANVNRWRGQIGLAPTDEQGLIENVQITDSNRVVVVDIPAEQMRLIGTLINVGDGKTWFAKAVGDNDALELIKADLVSFSESFHTVNAAVDDGHDHSDHDGHDHSSDGAGQTAEQSTGWKIPVQWTPDQTLSSMMIAGFTTDSGARITLTSLSGDGGGVLSNVNRWRGQVELPQLGSIDEQPVTLLDDGSVIVDLLSEDRERRIVAGIMPIEGQTLFFKMTGTGDQTDPELKRFQEFVEAVAAERPGA